VTVGLPGVPVANAASISTNYGTATTTTLTGNGVISTYELVSQPSHGTATLSGAVLTYTPAASYSGADSLTFRVTGPGGNSAAATVSVTVGLPGAPVANAASISTNYGTATTATLTGSGVISAYELVSQPSHGTATLAGAVLTYTPAASYSGADALTFRVTGPGGNSTSAQVDITVARPTTILVDDFGKTKADTPVSIDLGANDAGIVGSVTIITTPAHGAVAISGTTAVYTPAQSYFGKDTFVYQVVDAAGIAYSATVSVTVDPGPTPLVWDMTATAQAGVPTIIRVTEGLIDGPFTAVRILSNVRSAGATIAPLAIYTPSASKFQAHDINQGPTSFNGLNCVTTTSPDDKTPQIVSEGGGVQLENGTLTVSGLDIIFTPNVNFKGVASFDFAVANAFGWSTPATVWATVHPTPVAASVKTARVLAGKSVSVKLTQGATGGPFTAAVIVSNSRPTKGSAEIRLEGADYILTFTPKGSDGGTTVITYTLANEYATSAPAIVEFVVSARPDPAKDPETVGVFSAMSQSLYRFGSSQMANISQRLETLHAKGPRRSVVGLTLVPIEQVQQIPNDNAAMKQMLQYLIRNDLIDPTSSKASSANADKPEKANDKGVVWWAGGAVDLVSKSENDQKAGLKFSTNGISLGADIRPSTKLTVGLGVGFGQGSSKIGTHGSKLDGEDVSAFAYASYQPTEKSFIDILAGHGNSGFKAQRYVSETGNFVSSARDGTQEFFSIRSGWEIRHPRLHLSPYAGLEHQKTTLGASTEDGDDTWALTYDSQKSSKTTAVVGLHGDYLFRIRGGELSPTARFEYRQDVQKTGSQTVRYADWQDSPTYTVDSSIGASKSLTTGLGFKWKSKGGLEAGAEYEATFANDHSRGGRLKIMGAFKF
jgi:uncharacterized protein YhjY with autotransporter beta-barrel domain